MSTDKCRHKKRDYITTWPPRDREQSEGVGLRVYWYATCHLHLPDGRMIDNSEAVAVKRARQIAAGHQTIQEHGDKLTEYERARAARAERLLVAWEQLARDIGSHDKASIAARLSEACADEE